MKSYDVIVIGAGVLGCFAARALTALDIHTAVIEQREDVCTGITRANSGIIYTGCDNKPGSLKAQMCVHANQTFDGLCRELDVRFSRCGSLMAAFGPRSEAVLKRKLTQGLKSGVRGLRILSREEVLAMEPNLSPKVTSALFAPDTGVADPWELGIAAYENARSNGADFFLNETVLSMERSEGKFRIESDKSVFCSRAVINCAGLSAGAVREMLEIPAVRIYPTAADYLVLDNTLEGFIKHVIFHEPEIKSKGLTLIPTIDGSLLAGPTERERSTSPDGATASCGIAALKKLCASVVPSLPLSEQIRTFSALRPNPFETEQREGVWVPTERSIKDFAILNENGLISLIGIKTPGLTCASELGRHCAALAAEYLNYPGRNPAFDPIRRAPVRLQNMTEKDRAAYVRNDPEYGRIVCMCRGISQGEIREAIRRGAVTLDGVKRRTGAGMGPCQGGRCMKTILEMLADANSLRPEEVTKDGAGSPVLLKQI